jgi:hypothetical protein
MKSHSMSKVVLVAIIALPTVLVPLSSASDRPPVKNGPILTPGEAQQLNMTARTPKEHRKLGRYFNEEADQFEADAKAHDEMIAAYRNAPIVQSSETSRGVRTIEHCEFLARSDREMAKALREMAAAHEQLARAASGK